MPLDASDNTLSDERLMALYASGDAGAARALTARILPLALAHAFRVLGDRAEAEDVAQEAMLRLWKIAPQWQADRARVTTWIYRVVANLCTDRLRKGRAVATAPEDLPEVADDRPGAEEHLIRQARRQAVRAALNTLPERQRQAVSLRHLDGLSNPEIAAIMDISAEAVESLTARGKRALRAELAHRKDELGTGDE